MKKFLACMMVTAAACVPAFADDAADVKAAQQLADKYYETTRKAKDIEDVVPLMAKKNADKARTQPVPKEMREMAMNMLRSHVPNTYKVLAQKVEPNRVTLTLQSTDFPPQPLFALPKDAVVDGEFVAVKENDEWKVYKDYWTSKSKDGSSKTSWGANPDEPSAPELNK